MKKLPLVVLIAAYFFSAQSAFANGFTVTLTKSTGAQFVLAKRAVPKSVGTMRAHAYEVALEFAERVTIGNTVVVWSPSGDALVRMSNDGRETTVSGL